MFLESLYFSEILNRTIIQAKFPSKHIPSCNYTLLPATVEVLEIFMETIL